jgi:hypothetical protein
MGRCFPSAEKKLGKRRHACIKPKSQAMQCCLCAALRALCVCMSRHEVNESPLELAGGSREVSSKCVAIALLLSYLIKHCLQTHAHCASPRFIDCVRRAKSLKLQLLLGGMSFHFCNLNLSQNCDAQKWVVLGAVKSNLLIGKKSN